MQILMEPDAPPISRTLAWPDGVEAVCRKSWFINSPQIRTRELPGSTAGKLLTVQIAPRDDFAAGPFRSGRIPQRLTSIAVGFRRRDADGRDRDRRAPLFSAKDSGSGILPHIPGMRR
jgi:hypothetical protein